MTHAMDDASQDRRVRKTRNAIRAALTHLLTTTGAQLLTVKHIASEADIGYTTFFRHFPSKEAAIADLANSAAAALVSQSLPLIRSDGSRSSCLALCHHIHRNRQVWKALLAGGAATAVREAMLMQTLERSREWPDESAWLPRKVGTALATGLVIETLTWWLSTAATLTPAQVAEIMDRLFISALVNGSARRMSSKRRVRRRSG